MMPTSDNVDGAVRNQLALLRDFHQVRDRRRGAKIGPLGDALSVVARIFSGAVLVLTVNGCIATRSWVNGQLTPITGQLENTNSKADRALAGLQNLHLERQLVLDSRNGPTFAFGSAVLTASGKRQIDGFLTDLEGSAPNSRSASESLFVVAGYTDSVGSEDYNYELGQRRAARVVGYLVSKGIDPTQARAVSYGASKPIADNSTSRGRQSNRRVEISVYREKIATGS
jgi:outer membrane protein OmpA-like peptidoglycan-associated protein